MCFTLSIPSEVNHHFRYKQKVKISNTPHETITEKHNVTHSVWIIKPWFRNNSKIEPILAENWTNQHCSLYTQLIKRNVILNHHLLVLPESIFTKVYIRIHNTYLYTIRVSWLQTISQIIGKLFIWRTLKGVVFVHCNVSTILCGNSSSIKKLHIFIGVTKCNVQNHFWRK